MFSTSVAVVGLACRLPQASSPSALWQLLRHGRSAVTAMPDSRVVRGADEPGNASRLGGFLTRVDTFDAAFFGISPREAAAMDPQQRLMLELSWEVMEDAGIRPATLTGTRTGVFVGSMWNDYAVLMRRHPSAGGRHAMTGTHASIIANRISHTFGLRGPSLTIDTGQSSSLVAVHAAYEGIARGECSAAVAGGVNLMLDGESAEIASARFGGLSPDGRCHTFDADANGFVRGEGGAVVLLKPLADAVRDGDPVYCVIEGGAVNHDGAAPGLTSPSAAAQEDVLVRAYETAGVSPADVQYVELHGTGTKVGDPVEAAALGAALGRGGARPPEAPLRVGSVKTNVGHLEGAAGITGLLKAALSITYRDLPPSLNFTTPNPRIPLEELRLRVQDELTAWPRPDRRLIAGVSSFGMGGTNCHLVLAAAPSEAAAGAAQGDEAAGGGPIPWVLSARSAAGLRAQADRLRDHVAADPEAAPADVAHSLITTRTALDHRAVVLGDGTRELLDGLDALARDTYTPGLVQGSVDGGGVAVLFSGQGSQRPGMGRELYETYPVFATALDDVCAALDPLLDRPLRELMFTGEAASLDQTVYTQPALFAIETALYRLTESWGIKPDLLLGHSIGEITAVHVAGALSLPDACTLVAARARLMQSVTRQGAMAAWQGTVDEVSEALEGHGARVGIAAVNGPSSVVVSGDRDAVLDLTDGWRSRGRKTGLLRVGRAFHSPHMDDALEELRTVTGGLRRSAPEISVISNVTGRPVTAEQLGSPDYWAEHARQPVRFMEGLRYAREAGATTFIEIGPDALLSGMAEECFAAEPTDLDARGPVVVPALRRGRPEVGTFTSAMAQAYVRGVDVELDRFPAVRIGRRVSLPTYAFQRSRHWFDTSPDAGAPEEPPRPTRVPEGERRQALLELVRTNTAVVLGHTSPDQIDIGQTFKVLGFDSMGAAELSRRLRAATGLPLPTTLTFDHPTPAAVAEHLRTLTDSREGPQAAGRPAPRADAREVGDDPIAIVAMSCRYPGGVASPEDLWRLVYDGVDAIGELPVDRGWDLAGLFDPASAHAGTSSTREGGFLYDAAFFDADFFTISPREAIATDPQQRLLLETAWEAFERAGVGMAGLRGSRTGVFVGLTAQDYGPRLHEPSDDVGGFLLTGATPSVASGRVAFTFGLEGPAVSVDTACSSSLVAMHLACQSLRQGECTLALAGGATVLAGPGMFTEFSRQRGLAPDGRCKPFAAAADGTGWGEGVGLVLLERLSDARRNGRRVLAVIRGSAVNQDGASNGLTAPNGPSQERVIGRALASAGLSASEVDVVEAHGTGTTLGDPIEANALLATYGRGRASDRPLWLGSVKSNIGHTQAAAGIAGVIKMVMAMRHGVLPASLHIDEPTPHADWSTGTVQLLTEPTEWPDTDRPWRAGVSSFGISGTNAHLIVEQLPDAEEAPGSAAPPGVVPLALSARGTEALHGQAARLAERVSSDPDLSPSEVGWSLATTRTAFDTRAVVIGHGRAELTAGLEALAGGRPASNVVCGRAGGVVNGRGPVLVFPGQGSQWAGMGARLLEESEVFAARIAECERALARYVDWSLTGMLRDPAGAGLGRVEVVQPVLWAVMVSLAAVWAEHGVVPAAVVGHSQGEIAAACVAGAVSLEDAAAIVALRSRALSTLAGSGAMASLGAGEEQAVGLIAGREGVVVAAVNGPGSVVVSGPPDAVADVVAAAHGQGFRGRLIEVDYASHGPHIDTITDRLAADLDGIRPDAAQVALYSTVTGGRLETVEMESAYWMANLRRPVRFAEAIEAMLSDGYRVFIECSAHPVLTMVMDESFERFGIDAAAIATLRRDHDDRTQVVHALAQAFTAGVDVRWSGLFPADPAPRVVDLPTYAFQRRHYWLEPSDGRGGDPARLGLEPVRHPLLGAAVERADDGSTVLTGAFSRHSHPWLDQHHVLGIGVVSAAVLAEWAITSADAVDCGVVEELTLLAPLRVPDEGTTRVQVVVGAGDGEGRRDVRLYARPGGVSHWTCHAIGTLGPTPKSKPDGLSGHWPPPGAEPVDLSTFYEQAAAAGVKYGPAFQGLLSVWRHGRDLLAEVELPEPAGDADGFGVHPVLQDAALQPLLLNAGVEEDQRVWLPFSLNGLALWAERPTTARVRLSPLGDGPEQGVRVTIADPVGTPVLTLDSLVSRPVDESSLRAVHREPPDKDRRRAASVPARPTAAVRRPDDWAARLAGLSDAEQHRLLVDLVHAQAASVLGRTDGDPRRAEDSFKDLGFDSLTSVDLRDRLAAATGMALPAALVFRYPTPAALAGHLRTRLTAGGTAEPGRDVVDAVLGDLASIEDSLTALTGLPDDRAADVITGRLESLLTAWKTTLTPVGGDAGDRLRAASADELLDFIDNELGVS